jgi:hypothetical protein
MGVVESSARHNHVLAVLLDRQNSGIPYRATGHAEEERLKFVTSVGQHQITLRTRPGGGLTFFLSAVGTQGARIDGPHPEFGSGGLGCPSAVFADQRLMFQRPPSPRKFDVNELTLTIDPPPVAFIAWAARASVGSDPSD